MEFKSLGKILSVSNLLKGLGLIIGIGIIIATVRSLNIGHWEILGSWSTFVFKGIAKILSFGLPYLINLIKSSLMTVWLPITIYIVISLITTSRWWRFFLCLVAFCTFFLLMKETVISHFSLTSPSTIVELLIYLANIYLLLLWIFPRELWNFFGGILLFLQGAIVALLPSLPFQFDDFGIISAIFAFIFLYLHTLASFVQRIVDSNLLVFVRNRIAGVFKQSPQS